MDLADMLARLSTSTSPKIFFDCDLVIEAVTEDEAVKTAMYRELAGVLKDDAILASNTSTISITRMAQAATSSGALRWHALLLAGRPHGTRGSDSW